MKRNYLSSFLLLLGIFLVLFPISAFISAQNNIVKKATHEVDEIHEEKFIQINGIGQWVTIHGARSKPVILFLHGGPGSPISPYAAALYKEWEKDFVIVQWDQRGTGKTFGLHAPELTPEFLKSNPLTLDQMVSDGIELTEYLKTLLGKEKIILFGTSWGSALGVKMATKRPDLFFAYVGHSQIVNPSDDLTLYEKVYQLSQKFNDSQSLKILEGIGKPPYQKARNVGLLLRVVKKFERAGSTPPPDSWFVPSTGYDSPKDEQNRSDGDDYSFVNYVGDRNLGVNSIRSAINLMQDNLEFSIPVYLIQGEEDLLTPQEMTRLYFSKIQAPEKEYVLLPETAHGFNEAVLGAQFRIFRKIRAN